MIIRPTTSIIVSVYNDANALTLILDALARQSVLDFEIIISEDGTNPDIANTLAMRKAPHIKHINHADFGWRKNVILNKSIMAATGDYLIFIDGDCIPHAQFVAAHILLAQPKQALSGCRVEIGGRIAADVRNFRTRSQSLESIWFYIKNIKKTYRQ